MGAEPICNTCGSACPPRLSYPFVVRDRVVSTIRDLPTDLRQPEADRLCAMIQSLVMPEERAANGQSLND